MLVIKNDQLDAFKENALKKFEDDMVEHVRDFFPNHFSLMNEEGVRVITRFGYKNAKKYDLISQRNVCLYINSMLLLGSHFDTDPQYPWAKEILNDKNKPDPNQRIDAISEKTLDLLERISGPRHLHIYRAALNIKNNNKSIFQTLIYGDVKDAIKYFKKLFAKKCEVIGDANFSQMVNKGLADAKRYGITESHVLVYVLFMFSMGSGFDKDPQFPWAADILNDISVVNEKEKVGLLYNKAASILEGFLSKYKEQ